MIQTKGFFLIGGNSQRVCRKSPKSNIDFIILNFGGYRTIFVRVGYSLYSIWVSSLPIVLLFSAYVPLFSFPMQILPHIYVPSEGYVRCNTLAIACSPFVSPGG